MKLQKRITCTKCGQKKRIKWEIQDDDFAAGHSHCNGCGVNQVHCAGLAWKIAEFLDIWEQEGSGQFEPLAEIQPMTEISQGLH